MSLLRFLQADRAPANTRCYAYGSLDSKTSGRIFISYRRDETAFPASWLYERLAAHFGPDQVFKDVDSIELGDDFAEVIADAVGACDVLLVLIGAQWLAITDAAGRRRLEDSDDFVRLEIEAALQRKVRVIPILVGRARMPQAQELPASLGKLVYRQALELDPNRFEADTRRLLRVVEKTLAEEEARREAETGRITGGAGQQSGVDQRTAQADEERERQEPPEEVSRPVLPPAKVIASAPPVQATDAVDTTPPFGIPAADAPAGARPSRRLLMVAGLGLAGLLVGQRRRVPAVPGRRRARRVATARGEQQAHRHSGPHNPADELCTDEIKSNRAGCASPRRSSPAATHRQVQRRVRRVQPYIQRIPRAPLRQRRQNPPDYTMGTQFPRASRATTTGTPEPAILTPMISVKAIGGYPKVCARIAVTSHGLVHDKKGASRRATACRSPGRDPDDRRAHCAGTCTRSNSMTLSLNVRDDSTVSFPPFPSSLAASTSQSPTGV